MNLKKQLGICCLTLTLSSWASVGELSDVKVEISGNLKLKNEFNLTKLDPLYFLGGFKKIEVAELGDNKTEVKVLFSNDVFNENEIEDAEVILKKELNHLSALPLELINKLNSKDKEANCLAERRPFSDTKISSEFAFESLRASLTSIAAFHMMSLQNSNFTKDELMASFPVVRQKIEASMDKVFGVEKKPSSKDENTLKKYGVNKKDLDTREALLKSLDLLEEAQNQFKQVATKSAKKITPRLSVEKDGLAYILTIEKI